MEEEIYKAIKRQIITHDNGKKLYTTIKLNFGEYLEKDLSLEEAINIMTSVKNKLKNEKWEIMEILVSSYDVELLIGFRKLNKFEKTLIKVQNAFILEPLIAFTIFTIFCVGIPCLIGIFFDIISLEIKQVLLMTCTPILLTLIMFIMKIIISGILKICQIYKKEII